MTRKSSKRPKLTDAERHKRFLDMAREVGASERPEDFEKAFDRVVKPPIPSSNPKKENGHTPKQSASGQKNP
jgi:hypothetical protein